MIMHQETYEQIKKLLENIDKPVNKSFFSQSTNLNPHPEFRDILAKLTGYLEDNPNRYLNREEIKLLTTIGSTNIELQTDTIKKVLNEILQRDQSLSMVMSAIEDRNLINSGIKAALGSSFATTVAFFLPLSWPAFIATGLISSAGAAYYMENQHPGLTNAAINCITLAVSLNSKTTQLCLTITNDPKMQASMKHNSERSSHIRYMPAH